MSTTGADGSLAGGASVMAEMSIVRDATGGDRSSSLDVGTKMVLLDPAVAVGQISEW